MKKIIILLVALVWILGAMAQWTYTNLSEAKAYMGATILGSKAYFAGGFNNSTMLSTVEIYDFETGEWEVSNNLSVARELPFAVACGSKVLFAGGADFYGSGAVYATVDIYDTVSQSWAVEQLSIPRLQAAVVSHGNKVLFAGGANLQQGIVYDIVDIYDIETEEWTTASLSEPRVVWWAKVGDLAIFAGGYDLQTASKRVDIYNFTTDTWSIDSLSVGRAFCTLTTIGSKVMIAGGMTAANVRSNVVDIYDAATETWDTAYLSFPRAFCDNQNAVTLCGKAFFVGGGNINLNGAYWIDSYNVIDIYDEATDTWSVDYLANSPIHHAVVAYEDQFVVAGGIISSGYQSTVEIYTCPPSSCLPEGITFTTQEQIDNFQTNYPGCTEIEGDVIIESWESDITNLNGLSIVTSIAGDFTIEYTNALTSLSGLEGLTSIGGGLLIFENNVLTSLSGLEGLTSIGGDFGIYNNYALTNLTGLGSLASIEGSLWIGNSWYGGNPSLVNLTGINNLTSIGGDLEIYGNDALTSLTGLGSLANIGTDFSIVFNDVLVSLSGPENLTFIGGDFSIANNIALPDLSGLESLNTIGGYLEIYGNDALTSLIGLESLTSIGEHLGISYNELLTSLSGLNNLSHVDGNLNLLYNDVLVNLTGLESLYSIGGSLGIHENNQLISLSGMENLDSIGGALSLGTVDDGGNPPPPGGNDILVDLSSLENLTHVGGIDIGQNSSLYSLDGLQNINPASITTLQIALNQSLSTCDVQSICDYLASPNGTIFITDNAPGCNSPEEVEEHCLTTVEVVKTGNRISIIPNPVYDKITISLTAITGNTLLSIFNVSGEKVMERQLTDTETQIDISALPRGVYFVRVRDERMVEVEKIIKQ